MFIRYLLVFSYIFYCLKIRTNVTRYFQLNSPYFNEEKGIYSKLDIDQLIPGRWRLRQYQDNGTNTDFNYPVFVKPEWGQNAHGIQRADNAEELASIRRQSTAGRMPNIIQEAATEAREYEIFWVLSADDETQPAVLTVSEAVNLRADAFPINSIKNSNTVYRELTEHLTGDELEAIWKHVRSLGRFVISRVGLRADSIDALVNGDFHIIEINLFVPMPIHILDPDKSFRERVRGVLKTTYALARMIDRIPSDHVTRPIFFKKWRLSRKNKLLPLPR